MTRCAVLWYRWSIVGAFAFFAALLLSLAASTENWAAKLWVLVWLALSLLIAVRAGRAASVEFRADEIVIYGLLRTKRLAWSRVRDVGVTRGTSAALLPWRVPYFELDDGSTVRVDEIRSLRKPSIVDNVVAETRRRLDR